MRRTGICGATETLLVNKNVAYDFLPLMCSKLNKLGCEIVGDEITKSIIPNIGVATKEDWATEYLAPKLSIKIVEDIYDAINHIEKFGTEHTDAIMTESKTNADIFTSSIDSAIVMVNASTQFADGGEFGLGAEIGISTGRLHARGPVGAEQLTSFKYVVHGNGQIRS
jgi:glutamate-5-semialdehyde dehydrogenase